MATAKRLTVLMLAIALPFIAGCVAVKRDASVAACIHVDSTFAPGVYIGQDLHQALEVLGTPKQHTEGDDFENGRAIDDYHFETLSVASASPGPSIVRQISWVNQGHGPSKLLVVGESPRIAVDKTPHQSQFGPEYVIEACPTKHFGKTQIRFYLKNGKIDYISLETIDYPK